MRKYIVKRNDEILKTFYDLGTHNELNECLDYYMAIRDSYRDLWINNIISTQLYIQLIKQVSWEMVGDNND